MEYINTKIANVRQNFAAMQGRLSCPLCHQPLQIQNNSFSCSQGHCFDLSAQNYLNLAPQKKNKTLIYIQLSYSKLGGKFLKQAYMTHYWKICCPTARLPCKQAIANNPYCWTPVVARAFLPANCISKLMA